MLVRSDSGGAALALALRALGAAAALFASGCTLTRFDQEQCQTHSQCRESFGFGAVCNAQGLCENAPMNARCNTAPYPDDLFSHPQNYRDAVVIGSLVDQSMGAHVVRERAIRMAVMEADVKNSLENRKIGAVFCNIAQDSAKDNLTSADAAVASARYLSETLGVPALVGPFASEDTLRVWEAARKTGTVVMSPAATSLALGTLENMPTDDQPGYLWRVAPPDSLQGEVIANDMLERSIKSAVVISESGAYGDGLAQEFQDRFAKGGGTVKVQPIGMDIEIGDAALTAASDPAHDVLFISSSQDWVIKFLNAANGLTGYRSKEIFLTDAAANQAVLDGVPGGASLFAQIRGTRPAPRALSDRVYAKFVTEYNTTYRGEDPTTTTFSAHSFDGAWLVLYGAAWSLAREGRVSGLGISRGLRKVSAGNQMYIEATSWPFIINAFRAGQSVDVSGASGEVDFDPKTKNVIAPVEIWNITSASGTPAITHVATKTPGG